MKYPFWILSFLFFFNLQVQSQNPSEALEEVIGAVDEHKGYDRTVHPLGLYTEELYKKEAKFAREALKELKKINKERLSETEKISAELLRYDLQETVDFYEYEAYLNPLLSDAGFHVSCLTTCGISVIISR